MGTGGWYREDPMCTDDTTVDKMRDCVGPYNDIIDESVTLCRIALAALVIISAILCCLCYKWRNISESFLYIECIIRMIAVLIPNLANYR